MIDVTCIDWTPTEENPNGWVACSWEQGFNESIDTQEKDCVFNLEDVVLMPFTGLTDSTGREVYEGDIIRELASYWDREDVYQVVYSSIVASFLPLVLGQGGIEVIGNVWENPELLKEAHDK